MSNKSGGTEKPPAKPRRDSQIKSESAKKAADTFVEAYTTDQKRGNVTRAAQVAYPNQSPRSAAQTGSKLLKLPYIQKQIQKRRAAAAAAADVQRQDVVAMLTAIVFTSLQDVLDKNGNLNWKLANRRGIAHLIQEVDRTERHSKDGSRRVTTKYKMPSKVQAMELLSNITGWMREPAKNPIDTARTTFMTMRRDARYADMSDEELARYPASHFKVSVQEILEGQER